MPLRGVGSLLGQPLPVEAEVPSFVLGRHEGCVVVFQELLDKDALLLLSVGLKKENMDVSL